MKKEIEQRLLEVKKMFELMKGENLKDINDFMEGVNDEFERLEYIKEEKFQSELAEQMKPSVDDLLNHLGNKTGIKF